MLRNIPADHPRARSLQIREKLVEGFRAGIVVEEGLLAHGRGEAFDYLLGERTTKEAVRAMKAGLALILTAKKPVISVNGNTACLCAREIVELAQITSAAIEVNLFYRSVDREIAIEKLLTLNGATKVFGVGSRASETIPELMSERRRVDPEGIYSADVVFVPLKDGDRTEALKKMGKQIITVDLNPFSRTAQTADVTIVDNIVRALPRMLKLAKQMKNMKKEELKSITVLDNKANLAPSLNWILLGLLKAN